VTLKSNEAKSAVSYTVTAETYNELVQYSLAESFRLHGTSGFRGTQFEKHCSELIIQYFLLPCCKYSISFLFFLLYFMIYHRLTSYSIKLHLNEGDYLEDLGVDSRTILKWTLKKQGKTTMKCDYEPGVWVWQLGLRYGLQYTTVYRYQGMCSVFACLYTRNAQTAQTGKF
jgi:hypothetical protein